MLCLLMYENIHIWIIRKKSAFGFVYPCERNIPLVIEWNLGAAKYNRAIRIDFLDFLCQQVRYFPIPRVAGTKKNICSGTSGNVLIELVSEDKGFLELELGCQFRK